MKPWLAPRFCLYIGNRIPKIVRAPFLLMITAFHFFVSFNDFMIPQFTYLMVTYLGLLMVLISKQMNTVNTIITITVAEPIMLAVH